MAKAQTPVDIRKLTGANAQVGEYQMGVFNSVLMQTIGNFSKIFPNQQNFARQIAQILPGGFKAFRVNIKTYKHPIRAKRLGEYPAVSGETDSSIDNHGIAFQFQLGPNLLGKYRFVLSRRIIHFSLLLL
jgi:hypothetical protein